MGPGRGGTLLQRLENAVPVVRQKCDSDARDRSFNTFLIRDGDPEDDGAAVTGREDECEENYPA